MIRTKLLTKSLIGGLCFAVSAIILPQALASNSFQILTQSDSQDYIGGGKHWNFSPSNNSKLDVVTATDSSVTFNAESFDISWMRFEFSAEEGKKLQQGLYYPAKRNAFRGSYNGIDIGGDGRGCNTIVGGFYVHEYVVTNNTLQRAAIDFVQYCEGGKPGLYGSLRYNSTVAASCSKAGECAGVKKTVLQQNTQQPTKTQPAATTSSPDELTPQQEKEFNRKLAQRISTWRRTYRVFMRNCQIDEFLAGDENACKGKFKAELNEIYEKVSSQYGVLYPEKYTKDQMKIHILLLDIDIKQIQQERATLRSQKQLTTSKEIYYSGVLIQIDLLKMALEILSK